MYFVTQWRNFLVDRRQNGDAPSFQEIVDEYDRLVAAVELVHPGFMAYVSSLGLDNPVVPVPVVEIVDLTTDDQQVAGESTSESPQETIQRVEEIIDLTLD